MATRLRQPCPALATFTSLPREVRDQIYTELLVSTAPIVVDDDDADIINSPSDHAVAQNINLLYEWSAISNAQIAAEACSVFYANNTFRVASWCLPDFIVSDDAHHLEHGVVNIRDLVRKLEVTEMCSWEEEDPGTNLGCLLQCAQLREVKLQYHDRRNFKTRFKFEPELRELARVCRLLRDKLGPGLLVCTTQRCDGDGDEDDPACQEVSDVSWMYEPLDEQGRACVGGRDGEL